MGEIPSIARDGPPVARDVSTLGDVTTVESVAVEFTVVEFTVVEFVDINFGQLLGSIAEDGKLQPSVEQQVASEQSDEHLYSMEVMTGSTLVDFSRQTCDGLLHVSM